MAYLFITILAPVPMAKQLQVTFEGRGYGKRFGGSFSAVNARYDAMIDTFMAHVMTWRIFISAK